MKLWCMACKSRLDHTVSCCPVCFRHEWLAPLPFQVADREVTVPPRKRAGIVRAGDLRVERRPGPFGEPWASAWQLGDPAAIELVGLPGQGKSHLATQLALSAARQVRVLYLSVEEQHKPTIVERINRLGLDDVTGDRLRVADARTMDEVYEDLRKDAAPLVVIDSASELGASVKTLVEALDGRSFIVLNHVNSRRRTYGGEGWAHAVDVVIEVHDGLARPTKNRFSGNMTGVRIWPERSPAQPNQ